jgi:hypothetical protein
MSVAKIAQVLWHEDKQKYSLSYNGKALFHSAKLDYIDYKVHAEQLNEKHHKVREYGITSYEVVSRKPDGGPIMDLELEESGVVTFVRPERPVFTINERFDMLGDLISMVINKNARSVLLTGEGGVGKTFTVLERLTAAGKIDVKKAPKAVRVSTTTPKIAVAVDIGEADDDAPIEPRDPAEIEAAAQAAQTQEFFENGDYVIMKGYSSAAGLYEFLYQFRDKIIIFDDCDSVLKDSTAINLLKAALDTYEERWVTWNTSSMAASRTTAPNMFLFTGSIIFISNMNVRKVDEAVRTRCHKVDVSMNNPQRIERMRHVITTVMPDVDMNFKIDALNLLDEYKDITTNVNFRSWMDTISIRKDPSVSDWRRLALFSLLDSN